MQPDSYPVVGLFQNDTQVEIRLFLEMVPEEVVLSPGHSVELLARPSADLLPLDIEAVDGGFHVHARREWDPNWHVRFRGQVIKARHPTVLKEFE
jgi:hypothetical protein